MGKLQISWTSFTTNAHQVFNFQNEELQRRFFDYLSSWQSNYVVPIAVVVEKMRPLLYGDRDDRIRFAYELLD